MLKYVVQRLGLFVGLKGRGQFLGVEAIVGMGLQMLDRLALQFEHAFRRFFAGLDAGLVIRVDVDQLGIQPDRAFIQRDQPAERRGIEPFAFDGQRLPTGLGQRLPRAEIEPIQIITAGNFFIDFQMLSPARARHVLAHDDEIDEKVVKPLTQLLHERMLIRRPLVAIHRDALIHLLPIQVPRLAQRLHHQLLQVAREQQQPILVRQQDHVFLSPAVGGVMPHPGQDRRRVVAALFGARGPIHRGRAFKKARDVQPLQRHGHQPHRRGDARPPADPVPHGKSRQPSLALGLGIELGPFTGNCHRVFGKL